MRWETEAMVPIFDEAEEQHRLPDTSLVPLRVLCLLLTAGLSAVLDPLCFTWQQEGDVLL